MTKIVQPKFVALPPKDLASFDGKIVVFADEDRDFVALQPSGADKAVKRLLKSERFEKLSQGDGVELPVPDGLSASALQVVKLKNDAKRPLARKAGVWIAKNAHGADVLALAEEGYPAAEIAFGLVLRSYQFDVHKTGDKPALIGDVRFAVAKANGVKSAFVDMAAIAQGVVFTRDLTNEPANILNTTEFARRLKELTKIGLSVEIIEEKELKKLGMNALLGVGIGSETPTKMVVLKWMGGGKEAPFALVGKGVVFDTGGISIKSAAGMEDMTMDMGGAGVVAGVMKTLALRKAKANVVALVGLVENMPDGKAQRPGDVVRSMKGDTIEVINTDAEGRLVLADVLWYAQETFKPTGIIDLATLTGAVIIGLGHEKAGVFSNDKKFRKRFLKAAGREKEGAWPLPLDPAYADLIKSRVADIKNTGGRPAGSITAAEFLHKFVKDDTPWIHLDIAGVAFVATETAFAPQGATGWGVRSINRYIKDNLES